MYFGDVYSSFWWEKGAAYKLGQKEERKTTHKVKIRSSQKKKKKEGEGGTKNSRIKIHMNSTYKWTRILQTFYIYFSFHAHVT